MTALEVIECAVAHIGEIHGQLNFPVNFFRGSLIVPGIAVPAVKVAPGGQRFPALRFSQLIICSQIAAKDLFHQWMQTEIDETLVEQQHIFDQMTINFGLLIAFKVIPAHSSQTHSKGSLHIAQLLDGKQRGQNHDAVGLELGEQSINCRPAINQLLLTFLADSRRDLFDVSHLFFNRRAAKTRSGARIQAQIPGNGPPRRNADSAHFSWLRCLWSRAGLGRGTCC